MQLDLLDRNAACEFFGGNKPIDPATLYRGIRKGRLSGTGQGRPRV